MQTVQGSVLQSLRSARAFLNAYVEKLGELVNTGVRRKLDEVIAELTACAATQSGSELDAKSATQRQLQLRAALLRDHMAPIAGIAAADLPATPEMKPLRMPRGRPTVEKLAGLATGMAEAAAKFAGTFIGAGLPADFVSRLSGASDAMLAAVDDRTHFRNRRIGATKTLKTKLAHGRKLVGALDKLVKSALRDDAELLHQWNRVKRVQLSNGRAAESLAEAARLDSPDGPAITPAATQVNTL